MPPQQSCEAISSSIKISTSNGIELRIDIILFPEHLLEMRQKREGMFKAHPQKLLNSTARGRSHSMSTRFPTHWGRPAIAVRHPKLPGRRSSSAKRGQRYAIADHPKIERSRCHLPSAECRCRASLLSSSAD